MAGIAYGCTGEFAVDEDAVVGVRTCVKVVTVGTAVAAPSSSSSMFLPSLSSLWASCS